MGHYAQSGFPIRKSPDRSLVADSPGLIAGSYVLLRLLVPRHSPCALINLATTDDARVHCAVLKIRAVPSPAAIRLWRSGPAEVGPLSGRSLRTQQRARPAHPPDSRSVPPKQHVLTLTELALRPNNQCSTSEQPPRDVRSGCGSGRCTSHRSGCERQLLLRKEVIQPHLPVRLPCYDFVPIAGPTFDGSLPYGLGHRLRVLPTFVT
jgi:hypothetical protein